VAAERAARTAVQQELTRLLANVEAAQVAVSNDASLIALERLERQLLESTIRAPISGTVTEVYASVGGVGAGLLFVVEDTNDLKISAGILEFDAARVREGMAVEIRSDAAEAAVFYGSVVLVDPAATRSPHGNVEFGVEISIITQGSPLLIGMSTRLAVIIQERENVFAVPFDAVGRDINGHYILMVSDADINGNRFARRVDVETGLDNDLFIEIYSEVLFEGMKVLNNAASFSEGMTVKVE
jgi:multidrug efflux pump subunit AcrA (membrane-fusion protein)